MKNLIEKFYTAFANLDAETMVACYHPDIRFEDPAFGVLHGKDAGDMWRMLCKNAKDFEVEFSGIETDAQKGMAKWEARYTFSKTGRSVHNIIVAQFKFKDGKIIEHTDTFNLHSWAKQAMGFKGLLLGGTSFFKEKLLLQTASMLRKFQAKS